MTETELKAHLAKIRKRMINDSDQELSSIRQDNLNAYMGEPYGTEREGRSTYVTREVMEAIEWALPSLLRTFTAGDKIVTFDPVGREDEDQADQETDIVNHYLLNENNGFLTFYEWFKDAMMNPVGYSKIYTEIREEVKTERYNGITEAQIAELDGDDRVEMVAADPREDGLFDLEVKVTLKEPKLKFEAIPPEQALIDNDHTSISLDGCPAVCHRVKRTRSYLLQAGYDAEKLDLATAEDDEEWNDERVNRQDTEDEYPDGGEDHDANKTYWLEEWYLEVDFNGDGIAENRKVDYIGGQIFENIEYDYQPICALSCMPMSHRHSGMSMAELMRPIQELSTFFRRGVNDNIGQILEPRKYVNEQGITDDGATLDQLLDPVSSIVVTRGSGMIEPEQHQPIIGELMQAIATLENEKQVRSGVAPNLSLDPEVLQQSTMGGFTAALQEASQRIELIARIFAETGVKDAMIKAHRQIKEHQNQAKSLRIRGNWVETNPADWRDRINVSVNVGLGFNNKEKQLAVISRLLEIQKEALPIGLATTENLYNSLEQLVDAAGLKQVDRYFTHPSKAQPPEPQEDPMLVLGQQQLQLQAMKDRADQELKVAQQQHQQLKDQREQELKSRDLDLKEREQMAGQALKQSQTYKTTEEAKRLDVETDGMVNGLEITKLAADLSSGLDQRIEQARVAEQAASEKLAALQELTQEMAQPKRIIRDEQGNVVGAEMNGQVTRIMRDETGRIIGTAPAGETNGIA